MEVNMKILFTLKTQLISFIYRLDLLQTDYGRNPAATVMQEAFHQAAFNAHWQLVEANEADWDLMGSLTEELTNWRPR